MDSQRTMVWLRVRAIMRTISKTANRIIWWVDIEASEQVGALVPEPLYMRVDGVYLGNVFHVTEIEGVEPYLEMSNAFFPSEVVANAVGAIYSRFTLRRLPYES